MKKIMTLFIAVALIASFGIGAIAGANEDAFANAVMEEQTQLVLEKAAIEFSQGHDAEGLALEGAATNNFGKTKLGFHRISGAVITASYYWKQVTSPTPGWERTHKPRPKSD